MAKKKTKRKKATPRKSRPSRKAKTKAATQDVRRQRKRDRAEGQAESMPSQPRVNSVAALNAGELVAYEHAVWVRVPVGSRATPRDLPPAPMSIPRAWKNSWKKDNRSKPKLWTASKTLPTRIRVRFAPEKSKRTMFPRNIATRIRIFYLRSRRHVRRMRIGIISDTHGLLRPEAERALQGVGLIIHAGDVGDPEILATLKRIAPVFAVRGNVDTAPWAQELPAHHRRRSRRRKLLRATQPA